MKTNGRLSEISSRRGFGKSCRLAMLRSKIERSSMESGDKTDNLSAHRNATCFQKDVHRNATVPGLARLFDGLHRIFDGSRLTNYAFFGYDLQLVVIDSVIRLIDCISLSIDGINRLMSQS